MQHILERLERHILHGLASEWENALSILNPSQRGLLRLPLFSIKDMKGRWGFWSGQKREISLSRGLVHNHPWFAIKEVLLHEMAHQYADEVLFARDEPPHGPSFQRACYILRANPRASGNFKPLDQRITSSNNNPEDKITRQVKKLLSLAKSKNRFEAEAAMAKAQALLAKHNREILKTVTEREYMSIFLGRPALRHNRAEYMLAHLLQDFYFVKIIWVSAYVLGTAKMGRVLEISGSMQNVSIASYTYDFINNFISSKWYEYNKNKGLSHRRKIDFSTGIIEGFRVRLLKQGEKQDAQMIKAVIKVEDPQLVKYFRYRYPYIRNIKKGRFYQDKNVISDGKAIGEKLIIYKGINEENGGKIYLIE